MRFSNEVRAVINLLGNRSAPVLAAERLREDSQC